jgi:hypothetical protein
MHSNNLLVEVAAAAADTAPRMEEGVAGIGRHRAAVRLVVAIDLLPAAVIAGRRRQEAPHPQTRLDPCCQRFL